MCGDILKKIWKGTGISQEVFAKKLGISKSALHQQFNSSDLRTGTIEKFCKVLNLKINDLYKDTEFAIENNDEHSMPLEQKISYLEGRGDFVKRFEELVIENSELKKRLQQYEDIEKRNAG